MAITDKADRVESNSRPPVFLRVMRDITDRVIAGINKYGTPLQPFNGRNALRDAYEEAQDLTMYLAQALEEQDNPQITDVIPIELEHFWGGKEYPESVHTANGHKSTIYLNKSALAVLVHLICPSPYNATKYTQSIMPSGRFARDAARAAIMDAAATYLGGTNKDIANAINTECRYAP